MNQVLICIVALLALRFAQGEVLVTTIAGTGAGGTVLDGPPDVAQFDEPTGLGYLPDGTLMVVELTPSVLRTVDRNGTVTTIAGIVGNRGAVIDGSGSAVRFNRPQGLRVYNGVAYITDRTNCAIRRAYKNGTVDTFFRSSSGCASADGQTGSGASLFNVLDLVFAADGTIYFTERDFGGSDDRIRKIVGNTISTLAGGSSSSSTVDGDPATARFNNPTGLALNGSDVIIVQSGDGAIRKYDAATQFTSQLLLADNVLKFQIVHHPDGNFYITSGSVIRKMDKDGVLAPSAYAGTGASGASDGDLTSATFSSTSGITVAPCDSSLTISQTGIDRIRNIGENTFPALSQAGTTENHIATIPLNLHAAGASAITWQSSNQSVVADSDISVPDQVAQNRVLQVNPRQLGNTTITLKIRSCAAAPHSRTFTFSVSPGPQIVSIGQAFTTVNRQSAAVIVKVRSGTPPLIVTATSQNQALVADSGIQINNAPAFDKEIRVTALGTAGQVNLTIVVTDASNVNTTGFLLVTINPNPTISYTQGDKATTIGRVLFTLPVVVNLGTGTRTVTGSSSIGALVPSANFVVAPGDGTNQAVTIHTSLDAISNLTSVQQVTITFTVTDTVGATAQTTFTLTINPIPSFTPALPARSATQGLWSPWYDAHTQFGTGTVTVTCTSTNQAVLQNSNIQYQGSGATQQIRFLPENVVNLVSVNCTANDTVGASNAAGVGSNFNLTVYPVPTLSPLSPFSWTVTRPSPPALANQEGGAPPVTVDVLVCGNGVVRSQDVIVTPVNSSHSTISVTPQATGTCDVTLRATDASGAVANSTFAVTGVALPTITGLPVVAVQTTVGVATGPIPFTLNGGLAPVTITAASNNDVVVPTSGLFLDLTPGALAINVSASNQAGSAQITVTPTDSAGGSTSPAFLVTVNAAPTISAVGAKSATEQFPVTFNINVGLGTGNLLVNGSSSNTSVIPDTYITITPASSTVSQRAVTVNTALNKRGTSTITLRVTDAKGVFTTTSFVVTVNPQPSFASAIPEQFGNGGSQYTFALPVRGGTPPYTFTWTTNPDRIITDIRYVNNNGEYSLIVNPPKLEVTVNFTIQVTGKDSADFQFRSRPFYLTVIGTPSEKPFFEEHMTEAIGAGAALLLLAGVVCIVVKKCCKGTCLVCQTKQAQKRLSGLDGSGQLRSGGSLVGAPASSPEVEIALASNDPITPRSVGGSITMMPAGAL